MGNRATECGWRHAPEARRGFGGFWKSHWVELSPASEEDGWLSLARRSQANGLVASATRVEGADGKVIIERLCISLPYVETFNSKVIKGFVPELRSRYVFFVFRDSNVLCIYFMNIICTFHTSVSGYVTDEFPPRSKLVELNQSNPPAEGYKKKTNLLREKKRNSVFLTNCR